MTSAPSRLPASSKLVRVRVEVLEEKVDQRPPAQQVALGFSRPVQQHVAFGEIQEMLDLGRMQALDDEQVSLGVTHGPVRRREGRTPSMRT